jgi:hypothetical protein
MIVFTPDAKSFDCEWRSNDTYTIDPEGSVSVIRLWRKSYLPKPMLQLWFSKL